MTKQSGLGDNLYVAGYDVSGDTQSVEISGGFEPLDLTDITQSAYERTGGLRKGSIKAVTYFDDAAGKAHPVLGALPLTDRIVTYCRGTSLGSAAASVVAKQLNYDGSRDQEGNFTFTVECTSNGYGLEWGQLLTAGLRTDTTATNGTGVDFLVSTAFGLQAYLHVFSFTGTSVTVKIQESSDNGGADAWADVVGGGFTAATAIGSQRIQTTRALTVERYLRVVTTGTFTNAVIAVSVTKNESTVNY